MNIFYLGNPQTSARELCDKHVVKMITESAQMLCTVHWCKANTLEKSQNLVEGLLFKPAHINHPSTIWTRETHENYRWLLIHFITLCEEYYLRYAKYHASWTKLYDGLARFPMNIQEGGLTNFAQAMPNKYKHKNHITAYRQYMIAEKYYAKWEKGTNKPTWWK